MSNKKHGIRYNTHSFIEKARTIHGNKFDYSLTEYQNSRTKINIICTTHGVFEQRPCDHINQQQGCPKCSHNFPLSQNDFIEKSKSLYGEKYKLISEFKGIKQPVTLSCSEHGEFKLKYAEVHFRKNGGCPDCWYLGRLENLKPGNISKIETEWLDSLSVPLRQYKLVIDDQTFLVDGFDPSTNTVYECYGSFWHGNPEKYDAKDINTKTGKTFGELYEKTIQREQIIKQYYHLITKWI